MIKSIELLMKSCLAILTLITRIIIIKTLTNVRMVEKGGEFGLEVSRGFLFHIEGYCSLVRIGIIHFSVSIIYRPLSEGLRASPAARITLDYKFGVTC